MIISLAWRNIWRNKIRSLIIMFSVGLGLFAGLAVNALYSGMMKGRLYDLIFHEIGHIQIHHPGFKVDYNPNDTIEGSLKLMQYLKDDSNVYAYSVRSLTTAMLASASGSSGVLVNGIDVWAENKTSGLKSKLISGRELNPESKKEIMIGKKLADKMKLHLGSKVVLTFTDTSSSLISGAFRTAAIFKSVNSAFDEQQVYVSKNTLDHYLGTKDRCHEIAVVLKDNESTNKEKINFSKITRKVQIESWSDIAPEIQLMSDTVDVYAVAIIIIIMFALSFGILNTMLMALLERTREIGMMEALGMSLGKIVKLVVLETLFLTMTGLPLSLVVSYFIIDYYHQQGMDLSGMGNEMMNSFGFNTLIYPEFPTERLPAIMAIVLITALTASLLPALRMIKLNPVKSLSRMH